MMQQYLIYTYGKSKWESPTGVFRCPVTLPSNYKPITVVKYRSTCLYSLFQATTYIQILFTDLMITHTQWFKILHIHHTTWVYRSIIPVYTHTWPHFSPYAIYPVLAPIPFSIPIQPTSPHLTPPPNHNTWPHHQPPHSRHPRGPQSVSSSPTPSWIFSEVI